MRRRVVRIAALAAGVAVAGSVVLGGVADASGGKHAGRRFRVALSGAQEVSPTNAHGNDDRGSATLWLNQGRERICWRFGALTLTAGEALPTASHIHEAPAGVAGPIRVTLFGAPPNPSGPSHAAPAAYPTGTKCVKAAKALIKDIRQHPAKYYVNMHNATHPSGAVRGQLHK